MQCQFYKLMPLQTSFDYPYINQNVKNSVINKIPQPHNIVCCFMSVLNFLILWIPWCEMSQLLQSCWTFPQMQRIRTYILNISEVFFLVRLWNHYWILQHSGVCCQLMLLINFCSLVFSLTPFGWLHFIMLTFYLWYEYHYYLSLSDLHPLFQERN